MRSIKFVGPPGTGKTRSLLDRIVARSLNGEIGRIYAPEQILFSTYTRAGAYEARDRAMAQFELGENRLPYFRTLHSICSRLLGGPQHVESKHFVAFCEEFSFRTEQKKKKAKGEKDDALEDAFLPEPGKGGGEEAEKYLAIIDLARNCTYRPCDIFNAMPDDETFGLSLMGLARFDDAYRNWKHREGLCDYTDMIERVLLEEITPPGVRVMAIDEAQDLTRLQTHLVEMWRAKGKLDFFCLAGDDDQELYDWNGSYGDYFINCPVDEVIALTISHRVPVGIGAYARRLIERNTRRLPKTWSSSEPGGKISNIDGYDHLAFLLSKLEEIPRTFVLARHGFLLGIAKQALMEEGIPHGYNKKGNPYRSLAPQSILCAFFLANKHPVDMEMVAAMTKKMPQEGWLKRGAKSEIDRLKVDSEGASDVVNFDRLCKKGWFEEKALNAFSKVRTALDPLEKYDRTTRSYYLKVCLKRGLNGLTSPPPVILSTIHGVKGMEADNVFLDTRISGKTKKAYDADPEPERRVYYVGMTRAKKNLHFVNGRGYRFNEV